LHKFSVLTWFPEQQHAQPAVAASHALIEAPPPVQNNKMLLELASNRHSDKSENQLFACLLAYLQLHSASHVKSAALSVIGPSMRNRSSALHPMAL
jgi:hypothetical protein